jgi:AcrR family transcriptional regulator
VISVGDPEDATVSGRDPRRRRGNDDRREHILTAAAGLFTTGGYNATTIPKVCAAAGVGIGTFYMHFAGKPAVAKEIAQREHVRLVAWTDGLDLAQPGLLERAISEVLSAPNAGLESALTEAEAIEPGFRAFRRELRRAARERLREAVVRSRQGRAIRADLIDPDIAGWAFLGLLRAAIVDGWRDRDADIAALIRRIASPAEPTPEV